jgi:predicted dehydrogenase
MTKVLTLGFIGGGVNSAIGDTHFIASQMDNRFKVVAGCFSRHADINIQTAEKWGIASERQYQTVEDMLLREKGRLDAIVVLSPTPNHVEPIINALRQGFAVISEKALAGTCDEVLLIKQAQQQVHGFVAVTYNYTGYPMLRELRQMVQLGKLGRLEQIHIEMPQEGFVRLNRNDQPLMPQQWRLSDRLIPTISLDLGVHVHQIIEFLSGEKPLEVVSLQRSQGNFKQIIDNTMCIARYTNDIDCSIWYSKSALGYRNGLRVRLFGDAGSAEWHQMEPEFLLYHDNKGRKNVIDRSNIDIVIADQPRYNRFKAGHPAGFLEAFANHYWDIADSLKRFSETGMQEGEYTFSTQHALEGLAMLEAVTSSSNDHCWKKINIPGPKIKD